MRVFHAFRIAVTGLFLVAFSSRPAAAQGADEAINQTATDFVSGTMSGDASGAGETLRVLADSAHDSGEYSRALLLFQNACNQGSAKACHRAGEMYDANQGTNGQVDDETAKQWALSYYDGACQLGNAESCPIMQPYYDRYAANCAAGTSATSCVYIGNSRSYGWPYTGLQAEQAARDYDKACDQGLGPGCSSLGDLYFSGTGVEQSSAEGAAYYELGCRRGHAEVCGVLGEMYQRGDPLPFDGAKAVALMELGCNQQDLGSCKSLGYVYWWGEIVEQDKANAKALLSPVCKAGDVAVCNDLALLD